jgi:hypothetical protein
MEAVDFGRRMAFDHADVKQDHFQAGGDVVGTVGARTLKGRGWRNRSIGPRNVRLLGRHWCITVVGVDEPTLATATLMTPRSESFTASPSVAFCATVGMGTTEVSDQPVIVSRCADARPASFLFPNGMTLECRFAEAVANTCWIPDLTSAPSTDPTTEPVYSTRDWFLPVNSSLFGEMVGFYEEGQLFVN